MKTDLFKQVGTEVHVIFFFFLLLLMVLLTAIMPALSSFYLLAVHLCKFFAVLILLYQDIGESGNDVNEVSKIHI